MLEKDSWVSFYIHWEAWGWGKAIMVTRGKELEEEIGSLQSRRERKGPSSGDDSQWAHHPLWTPAHSHPTGRQTAPQSPWHIEASANRLGNLATCMGLGVWRENFNLADSVVYWASGDVPKNGAVNRQLLLQFRYMHLPTHWENATLQKGQAGVWVFLISIF